MAACSTWNSRVKCVLCALLLCVLLDQGEGFQLPGARRYSAALRVKKIGDEESNIKQAAKLAGPKPGGKKGKGDNDWREEQRQKEQGAIAAKPMSSVSAEDAYSRPAPVEEQAEAPVAAAAAAAETEAVQAAETGGVIEKFEAAVESILASPEDAAEALRFVNDVAMGGGGGGGGGVDMGGLFDDARDGSKIRGGRGIPGEPQRRVSPNDAVLRVPKKDPMSGGALPPETVFFGDVRRPPPVSSAGSEKYQISLLHWARHGNAMPRDSADRVRVVLPQGRLEPGAERHRLAEQGLSYEAIFRAWQGVMDDFQEATAFIRANLDMVPPLMFQRALTAEKLRAQYDNDLPRMNYLIAARDKHVTATDHVFFPLNIERLKAETRVMTYLARDELRTFAQSWDTVETTLHMTALMAARIHWDQRAEGQLRAIKKSVAGGVQWFQEATYNELMELRFRKPAITAQTYTNASVNIMQFMPAIYGKVAFEVKAMHETYNMMREGRRGDAEKHVMEVMCPREGVSPEVLKFRMRLLDSSLAQIQVRPPLF